MTDQEFVYQEDIGQFKYKLKVFTKTEPVGNCKIRLADPALGPDQHYLWVIIKDFFVFPNFRGKGVEKIMIERMLEYSDLNDLGVLCARSNHPTTYLKELEEIFLENGFKRNSDGWVYHTFDGGEIK